MIDRIEELLSGMAAEENDEEQEDVLALTNEPVVTASPHGERREAGESLETADGEEALGLETADGETALAPVEPGDRGGGRSAGNIAAVRPGLPAGEDETESSPAAGAEAEDSGTAGEPWKDGMVWTVQSVEPAVNAARELAPAERIDRTAPPLSAAEGPDAAEDLKPAGTGGDGAAAIDWTAARAGTGTEWITRAGTAAAIPDGARRMAAVQAGLEGLYRQTVEAARPAAPALPPEQAGRTAQAQEPGSAATLAVDELDRAVRRDSRRYDGGMTIF